LNLQGKAGVGFPKLLVGASVLAAPVAYFFFLLAVDPPAAGWFAGSWLARIADPLMLIGIFLAGSAGAARGHFAWAPGIGVSVGAARCLLGYHWWAEVYGNAAATQMAALFVIWAILFAAYGYIGGGVLREIWQRLAKGTDKPSNGAQVISANDVATNDLSRSTSSVDPPAVSRGDYYSLISRAVSALETNTAENRRALYERARAALLNELQKRGNSELEGERLALENAFRSVEIDVASNRPLSPKPSPGCGKEKTASHPPTFVFTDTDAGRKSFFELQCKYGDVRIEKGKGIIAMVLDPTREFPEFPDAVKVEPDGSQLALLKVISEDGGFIVQAKTPSGSGDRLKPGDFVLWVPDTLMEIPDTFEIPDKRLGWVGLIRAKINWMEVGTTGPFQLICRYD
jgi:hypothetical protein